MYICVYVYVYVCVYGSSEHRVLSGCLTSVPINSYIKWQVEIIICFFFRDIQWIYRLQIHPYLDTWAPKRPWETWDPDPISALIDSNLGRLKYGGFLLRNARNTWGNWSKNGEHVLTSWKMPWSMIQVYSWHYHLWLIVHCYIWLLEDMPGICWTQRFSRQHDIP